MSDLVYIVDDDVMFARALKRQIGGSVEIVTALGEAVSAVRGKRDVIIVLDVHFDATGESGIDAIAAFRKAAPGVLIIVTTGVYDARDEARAMAEKCCYLYLEKGNFRELKAAIGEAREALARLTPRQRKMVGELEKFRGRIASGRRSYERRPKDAPPPAPPPPDDPRLLH